MPIDYRVGEDGRFVRMEATEFLEADAMLDCVRRLLADPAVERGYRLLVDLSRVRGTDVTPETLAQVAKILHEHPERRRDGKTAILAGTSRSFEMSRFYETLAAKTVDTIVFNSEEVAKLWLGVA